MAFVIDLVLGENATQISHAGLGLAIGSLALPAFQFLRACGHPGGVAAQVHDRGRLGARQRH
jgi:hypothetical protein